MDNPKRRIAFKLEVHTYRILENRSLYFHTVYERNYFKGFSALNLRMNSLHWHSILVDLPGESTAYKVVKIRLQIQTICASLKVTKK